MLGLQTLHLHLSPDTLPGSPLRSRHLQKNYTLLQNHRIPVNTTDVPDLCKFSFTSSHRFLDPTTAEPTPLQVGVTTNVKGLISIEDYKGDGREVTQGRGCAVQNVGGMRRLAKSKAMDNTKVSTEDSGVHTPNRPLEQSTRHRLKWVAQAS